MKNFYFVLGDICYFLYSIKVLRAYMNSCFFSNEAALKSMDLEGINIEKHISSSLKYLDLYLLKLGVVFPSVICKISITLKILLLILVSFNWGLHQQNVSNSWSKIIFRYFWLLKWLLNPNFIKTLLILKIFLAYSTSVWSIFLILMFKLVLILLLTVSY